VGITAGSARNQIDLTVAQGKSTVTFSNGKKKIGSNKPDSAGIAFKDWKVKRTSKSKHVLRAKVRDALGRTATASRIVRVCK